MNHEIHEPIVKFSRRKARLFGAIVFFLLLVGAEGVARLTYFVAHDFNPYFLTFGFVDNTEAGAHSAEYDGYTKFQGGIPKHQRLKDHTIRMRINADGFRAAADFVRPKPAAMYRVVVLGASSTFGYYVEDEETFPRQIERLLREAHQDRAIEVLNLGIPHATSQNLLALARAELPSLQPDLIVIYSGVNDALHPKRPEDHGSLYCMKNWVYYHSVAWRFVHHTVKDAYFNLVKSTNTDPLGIPNLAIPLRLEREQIEALRGFLTARYRANIRSIVEFGRSLDAQTLLVTQPCTFYYEHIKDGEGNRMTYEEETAAIESEFAETASLLAFDTSMLAHRDLMQTLTEIATETGAPLADGIRALEKNREALQSYVHLTPDGNLFLAMAIRDAIFDAGLIRSPRR